MGYLYMTPAGFLLIDKPADWTSHDVVAYLRGVTKTKKVGHAGTLDPFATGLLIVGVGREATKRLDEFKEMRKEYVATVELGATSDTFDVDGKIERSAISHQLSLDTIKQELNNFVGKQQQIPPMYSAKKVQGKKLYELARKGIEVERKPNEIEIYEIELLEYEFPLLKVSVSCSTGTYIRTLANDIGSKLGVGGYCKELRRIRIGNFEVNKAKSPKELSRETYTQFLIQGVE